MLLNISFAIGDLWVLLSAIVFAVYSILLRLKPEGASVFAFQLSTFILGLIFLSPFYFWDYATSPKVEFDAASIGAIFYVGIFASLSAYVLWNKAVEAVGPSKAGMIYYTLPVFSGISAHFFLNESIGMLHLYSVVLIVAGILAANYESKVPD